MRYSLVLWLAGWGSLGWAIPAIAHGVLLDHQPISGIEVHARYDNGNPMGAAQVNVYAPNNPSEPWLTGTTDDDGRFTFTPDANNPGNWEVMVRQAGHGAMMVVPVAGAASGGSPESEEATAGETEAAAVVEPTPPASSTANEVRVAGVPLWVSMAAVVWGFVGTALFFSRGKR